MLRPFEIHLPSKHLRRIPRSLFASRNSVDSQIQRAASIALLHGDGLCRTSGKAYSFQFAKGLLSLGKGPCFYRFTRSNCGCLVLESAESKRLAGRAMLFAAFERALLRIPSQRAAGVPPIAVPGHCSASDAIPGTPRDPLGTRDSPRAIAACWLQLQIPTGSGGMPPSSFASATTASNPPRTSGTVIV